MRFKASPIDGDTYPVFFATAPFVSRLRFDYDAPPDDVWSVISGPRMWSWLPTVWGCRYPDGETPGPGTVRDFQMYLDRWLIYAQHERILHWDKGSRIVYTATDATLPFFGSWCEEYSIESLDAGRRTRLNWTLAVRPRYLGRLPAQWVATLLKPAFRFELGALPRELPMR
ncbi:SRPBCC family protein [Nocardia sp. NPDC051756]|uniref:SRPBCC family protein n=1 Tax=Nocardia sp. NPDC051756 TaxID=3154751 RepID=UPI003448027D